MKKIQFKHIKAPVFDYEHQKWSQIDTEKDTVLAATLRMTKDGVLYLMNEDGQYRYIPCGSV